SQAGYLELDKCDLTVFTKFDQQSDSNTTLKDSICSVQNTAVKIGVLSLKNTSFYTNEANIFSGEIVVKNNTDIQVGGNFLIHAEAKSDFSNGDLTVEGLLSMHELKAKNCNFNVQNLHVLRSQVDLDHCYVAASGRITLDHGASLQDVELHSQWLKIKGSLFAEQASFQGNEVHFDVDEGEVIESIVAVDALILDGGETDKFLTFTKSKLTSKTIRQNNNVSLDTSLLIDINDKQICHSLEGNLELSNSRMISANYVHNPVDSHLSLSDYSSARLGVIWNESKISADCSELATDSLWQENAQLHGNDSKLVVHNMAYAKGGEITLENSSQASINRVYHDGRLSLNSRSTLSVNEKLVIAEGAHVSVNDAVINAKHCNVLGEVALDQGVFVADNLNIYHKFTANNKSQVIARNHIILDEQAKLQLKTSALSAKKLNSFGTVVADNSELKADEMGCWAGSNTQLIGSGSIKANDFVHQGKLEVTTQKIKQDDKEVKIIPQIKVQSHFDISTDAKISGDDLILDAEYIDNVGSIELSNDLVAKGTKFDNLGHVKVGKSLFLGFDDAVVNSGMMASESATVHSNFFNVFGRVYAKKSFTSSGLVSMNLGLMSANNYSADSLFSCNAGIYVPNFSADLNYIFSRQNILSFSKNTLNRLLPECTNAINFAGMLPSIYDTGVGLHKTYQESGFEKFNKMRRHELMPLICQVKSAVMLGSGAFSTFSALHNDVFSDKSPQSNNARDSGSNNTPTTPEQSNVTETSLSDTLYN
ncbi:MAG: hypothetical protein M3R00_08790, partial [Pseudomonadota bacterium]|nr:hypothetical protein [Pseudomonadota bacterium]